MNLQTVIELIGYAGSCLIIVSMLMTSVVKLRVINTVGCAIFAGYAFCIHSYPTAAMQCCLIVINMVGLYKLLRIQKEYSVVALAPSDAYLQHFLTKNAADIVKYFPSAHVSSQCNVAYLVCCRDASVGIIVGTKTEDTLAVQIDYTIPMYRDCSVGKYLYAYLAGSGLRTLEAESTCPAHESYLQKMGFVLDAGIYTKAL